MEAIIAVLLVILKWLGVVVSVIVGLGVLLLIMVFVKYLCTDDMVYEDNSDGHVICGITDEPCTKSEICTGTCINCPIFQEDKNHE